MVLCDAPYIEGGRVIMCVQTMVVVGNRYMINVHMVSDKYWRLVIGTVCGKILVGYKILANEVIRTNWWVKYLQMSCTYSYD